MVTTDHQGGCCGVESTFLLQGAQSGAAMPRKKPAKGPAKKSKRELEADALAAALQRRQRKRETGVGLGVTAQDRKSSGLDALGAVRQARLAAL